jgi:ATP-dependent DNA helicase RecQ
MGINKANVKTVIHIQLPENMELLSRGGACRPKWWTSIYNAGNPLMFFRLTINLSMFYLIKVLNLMYNKTIFQIAYGEGINEQFAFNLHQFCLRYELPI